MKHRHAKTILKWVAIVVLVGYGSLIALLYVGQRSFLYVPSALRITPAVAGLPAAEEIVLDTADGEKIIAWHVPPRGDKPVALYFHGNGEIVAWNVERHRKLVADGTGLLALEYRGYGGSTGYPTEDGLHRDALTAYDFAAARYSPGRIVLWGHSLGSGVAVRLAAERPIAKLVLEAPFTSAADVAAMRFPFVPVRLLMKDQFRSDERIGKVSAPVLVLHGGRDWVIPIRFGERLYDMIKSPKRFVRLPDGDHIGLDEHGAMAAVRDFLADGSAASEAAGGSPLR